MFKQVIKSFLLILFLPFIMAACTIGAGSDGEPIEFTGDVVSISGSTIIVGGFDIDISSATTPTGLEIGDSVRVTGLQGDNVIIAVVVVIITETEEEEETPEATAEPEATSEVTAESEATSEVTAEPEATPEVTPIVESPTGEPFIVIEGPVEEININFITIFDIQIQVDPADPILTEIRIGDTIRIDGLSSLDGGVIIIFAVNITIIRTTVIIINNPGTVFIAVGIPSNCRVKKSGKITCRNSRRHSRRGSRRS